MQESGEEGWILLPPFLLSGCDAYASEIIPFGVTGYKRIRSSGSSGIFGVFGYGFYSFSNSLQFRGKRYQWYQSDSFLGLRMAFQEFTRHNFV